MESVKDGEPMLTDLSVEELVRERPDLAPVIGRWRVPRSHAGRPLRSLSVVLPDSWFEDRGIYRQDLDSYLLSSLGLPGAQDGARNNPRCGPRAEPDRRSITLIGGRTKSGEREHLEMEIASGSVVAVVGPTGAGKSRFLADIECLAQGDTPSGRTVLLDGAVPDPVVRYAAERRPVALLSQTMNFVMDLPADEFLFLHAECRGVANPPKAVASVLDAANALAGEAFAPSSPLTRLSGGQSRALMIADTALLSGSPIVLIDEIENAGVDRRRALDLFLGAGKIVVLSTHDPVLALLADRRLVIRDGGVREIFETSGAERRCLALLERYDSALGTIRDDLRQGRRLDSASIDSVSHKGDSA